jgi:Sec-independent protein secretion pathway component TatC
MIAFDVTAPFYFSSSGAALSITVAAPWIFYQVYAFAAPGLN